MTDELQTPCYYIRSDGFRYHVSYEDGRCYGRSQFLGTYGLRDPRDVIKADIRAHWDERNGIPLYVESDHGNVQRSRAIRLRRR